MQLKGSLLPMTVLELSSFELSQFVSDLEAKISQAPEFFENLPIVVDLDKYDASEALSFDHLMAACEQHSIRIVAVRGGAEHLQQAARQAGLGILAKQKERSRTPPEPQKAEPAAVEPAVETVVEKVIETVVETKTERQLSKVVRTPVRSGQQIYAQDGDLIVLASVSAGAEILADGNIHVYGALRGRALAGIKGDTSARIFCQNLNAELVSIAGQYKISEDLDKTMVGKPCQVFLEDDNLKFGELQQ